MIPSCTLVFGLIVKNATFQMQIFSLDVKTEAISKGHFPFYYPFTLDYCLLVFFLYGSVNPIA